MRFESRGAQTVPLTTRSRSRRLNHSAGTQRHFSVLENCHQPPCFPDQPKKIITIVGHFAHELEVMIAGAPDPAAKPGQAADHFVTLEAACGARKCELRCKGADGPASREGGMPVLLPIVGPFFKPQQLLGRAALAKPRINAQLARRLDDSRAVATRIK